MRLVTFRPTSASGAGNRIGALLPDDRIIDLAASYAAAAPASTSQMPAQMIPFFEGGRTTREMAETVVGFATEKLRQGDRPRGPHGEALVFDQAAVKLLAPVPRPTRMRDYLTYSAHAGGSGLQLPDAFYEMPICYKGNPYSVIGNDEEILWPAYTDQLDYELEIGFYIGKEGRNIAADRANEYIAAVTIFNDVSARDVQMREMSLSIGPSKGKDFSNVMGPCAVTLDEIDEWGLVMRARVNGEVWSEGTSRERAFSFAQVVAWASYSETIYPGEFLAVGTVGGGCGYELNRWLAPDDLLELEVEGIGVLRNRIGQKEQVPDGAGLQSYRIPTRAMAQPH